MAEGRSEASPDANEDPLRTLDSASDDASPSLAVSSATKEETSMDSKLEPQTPTAVPSVMDAVQPPNQSPLQDLERENSSEQGGMNPHEPYSNISLLGPDTATVEVDVLPADATNEVDSTAQEWMTSADNANSSSVDHPIKPATAAYVEGAAITGDVESSHGQEPDLHWKLGREEEKDLGGDAVTVDQSSDANLDWMKTEESRLEIDAPVTDIKLGHEDSTLDVSQTPNPETSKVETHLPTPGMMGDEFSVNVVEQSSPSAERGTEASGSQVHNEVGSSSSPQPQILHGSSSSMLSAQPEIEAPSDGLFWTEEADEPIPWEVEDRFGADIQSDKLGVGDWNQKTDSSGFDFPGNIAESSADWAKEMGLSTAGEPAQDSSIETKQVSRDAVVDGGPQVDSRQEHDIEDSWAKAFGGSESGLDDSWNAAFGEGFDDDDGLLQEPAMTSMPLQQPPPTTTSPTVPFSQSSSMNVRSSAYSTLPPMPTSTAAPLAPSTPMQFFEELPSAPVRARKPRQQMTSQPQSPPPPPQAQPRQTRTEPTSSSSPLQFRPPDRMDPFPPQPSVPVTSPTSSYPAGAPPQPASQAPSRYSPAPHVTPSFAVPRTAPQQSAISSKYATSQPQPPERLAARPLPPPSTRSPYAPAPAAPTSRGGKSPYTNSPPTTSAASPVRPSAPPAPTQGVPAANNDLRSPPISSAYSADAPVQSGPQNNPNQIAYASGPPAPPPLNRFAPRTSSPLAQQDYRPHFDRSAAVPAHLQEQAGEAVHGRDYLQGEAQSNQSLPQQGRPSPHNAEGGTSYSPPLQNQPQPEMFASIPPSRRPQTSSPKATSRPTPVPTFSSERVSTVQGSYSSSGVFTNGREMPHSLPSGQSEAVDFVLPSDETAADPLQRWKGAPMFHWGASGVVVTSLPSHVPRYGGGQTAPKMKPLAGEIKIQKSKELLSYREQLPTFPGPLKPKGKKKEVINWLASVIAILEKQSQTVPSPSATEWTKLEEKTVLWRVMRVLVEFDGTLVGGPVVEAAVRDALKSHSPPETQQSANPIAHPGSSTPSRPIEPAAINVIKNYLLEGNREKAIWYAVDNQLWAHALALSPASGPNIWKQVIQEFVKKEVRSAELGNQSIAALYQVLAGNWDESIDELVPLSARSGFQMISTASTPAQARDAFEGLNKWRETLSLILSNRSPDDENAILSLGKLLCGSGRIEAAHVCFLFAKSFAHFGGADDPQSVMCLLGVDHNNPWSNGGVDLEAIQLSEVYEFALSLPPTTSSSYAPHLQAYKLQHALSLAESGQRAEALQYCEFIASAIKSTTRISPYYNNTLISQLDDLQRRLSQTPKDGTSSWIPRPSIGKVSSSMGTWFNSFVAGDENDASSTGSGHHSEGENGPFARILGGTPIVSRSASSVDLHANYSAIHPTSSGASRYAPAAYAPRSAPGEESGTQGAYTPYSSSPEQRHGTYSPRQRTSSPSQSYGSPPIASAFTRLPSHLSQQQSYSPQSRPDSASSAGPRPSPSYEPYVPTVREEPSSTTYSDNYNVPLQPESESRALGFNESTNDQKTNGYVMASNGYDPARGGYQPQSAVNEPQSGGYNLPQIGNEPPSSSYEPSQRAYEPPASGYEPPTGGYEPPTGSYEPPSYQPYQSSEPGVEAIEDPKKKAFMDDNDDDLAARAEELKKQEKAQKDKAADDAFRAAAEADAARDKPKDKRATSGWFGGIGGLFGGKKDPNAPTVHKAKLGEESSFYFDNETKKWVNRKAGSSTTPSTSSSTAPPPRLSAPPSRNVSGAAGPPPPTSSPALPPTSGDSSLKPPPSSFPVREGPSSGPPSRSGTPASNADSAVSDAVGSPAGGDSLPPSGSVSGPPSAPQSRPPTSMSTVSSIDDLIGAPQARKGGTIKKGKKGQRYVDVMAK